MFKRLTTLFRQSAQPSPEQLKEAYLLGSDESEYGRLALQSKLFGLYIEEHKQSFVPFTPQRILDLGCGAGQSTWNLVAAYPDSQIVGVDRDAKAIADARQYFATRSNVQFSVGDIQEEFPPGLFDFISSTLVLWTVKQPTEVLRLAYKSLRPGGYIWLKEFYRWDTTLPQHPDMLWFYQQGSRVSELMGNNIRVGDSLKTLVQQAGFGDVREEAESYEASGIAGLSGATLDNLMMAITNASPQYVRLLNIPQVEINTRIGRLKAAQQSGELYGQFSLVNVIARKPAGTTRLRSP